jgi:hypothetical protein
MRDRTSLGIGRGVQACEMHRAPPGRFVWLLERVALIVALLLVAIVLIVAGILVATQLFIYAVEHGFLD